MKSQQRKRGFIPSYWCDFNYDQNDKLISIIIETNDPRKNKIYKEFPITNKEDILILIHEAEKIIEQLKSGQIN